MINFEIIALDLSSNQEVTFELLCDIILDFTLMIGQISEINWKKFKILDIKL